MNVYARGTLGDAFFILLKLGPQVTKVYHYSKHQHVYDKIKEIYSLNQNLEVEFLVDEPQGVEFIKGYINSDEKINNPFPEFVFPEVEETLPEEYYVVQLQSGLNQAWRKINAVQASRIPVDKPWVLVGTDDSKVRLPTDRITDLRKKTSLPQAFGVIGSSAAYFGPQGILSFVALSQQVTSTLFIINESDVHACTHRIDRVPEWEKYVRYIK